ncbi:ATP-dependent helicase HrpB [Halomonas binhaiensis]|uniref:ATP-dependent helicase HrpB n=1 Tax=Halomonas binhaiensis TaxID=2562282 RepID=UPI001F0750C6|nr:ATP-dependent helicase HrpB [Halomonas binhaiensis]
MSVVYESPALPIDDKLPQLIEALHVRNRALLVAEPGAGKTTRVPLALLDTTWCQGDGGNGRLLLLEPRRVAARLAAGYMAAQLGEAVGETVGYRMRGESRVGAKTRIEVVTQGVLARMLQDDPMLEGVSGVIFDEFHERSLEADLGLALTLDVQQGLREDLRLLVMSATLDVAALQGVMGDDIAVVECPGRQYPVVTHYRPPASRVEPWRHQAQVVSEALARVTADRATEGQTAEKQTTEEQANGDVLVILPGVAEIERLRRELAETQPHLSVMPLHGRMPLEAQRKALQPLADGRRRVVISTAICESSVTVDGVRCVIDAGLERVPVYQARTGFSRLETRRVNRASADQRRGRAGRQGPGVCYRLWAEEQPLVPHGEPEIQQADLADLAFELARWGVKDSQALSWVTAPARSALLAGRALLQRLGLLDGEAGLTVLGRQAARWPTHPRLAAMLEIASQQSPQKLATACALAAWLEYRDNGASRDLEAGFAQLLAQPKSSPQWSREARRLASLGGVSLNQARETALGALLLLAFPDRVAQCIEPGRFRLVGGGLVTMPADQALGHEALLIALDTDGDSKAARLYRGVRLAREDLEAHFPETRQWQERLEWSDDEERLVGERVRGVGSVILERRPLGGPPSAEACRDALLNVVRQRGQLPLDESAETLRARVALLRSEHDPAWPDLSDAALLAELGEWLGPHLAGMSRLSQMLALPWEKLLKERLPWPLAGRLDELAPTRLPLPSGDSAALRYVMDGDVSDDVEGSKVVPVLAAKLQTLFGCRQTPRIVEGRVPVRLELLSPAQRPLAVTMDLESFWRNVYPQVRKEMRGRYPKHPWPEDPFTASATRHTKRALNRGS